MSEWERVYWDEPERTVASTTFVGCVKCGTWHHAPLTGWDCPNCAAKARDDQRKSWGAYEVRHSVLATIHPMRYPHHVLDMD